MRTLTFLLAAFLGGMLSVSGQTLVKGQAFLMGSDFEIEIAHADPDSAELLIEEAFFHIEYLEALISSWDPASQTAAINRNAGKRPVPVHRELFNLIRRAQFVSELTEGAFDISYASMDRLWRFDGSMTTLPDSQAVRTSVRLINYQNIETDDNNYTVYLPKPGMRIGFGAIGKGFAAKQVMDLLKNRGVKSGVVNAGGDLITWGRESDTERWKVAIR
ncbi:MAG: FAD:protein FMN transferase, partial [Bacteroidota bacterium]